MALKRELYLTHAFLRKYLPRRLNKLVLNPRSAERLSAGCLLAINWLERLRKNSSKEEEKMNGLKPCCPSQRSGFHSIELTLLFVSAFLSS